MLTARVILYTVLVIVNVAAIIAWIVVSKRRHRRERPTWSDGVIGYVTSFLDTLGIGSYAQITALFKLRGRPDDELIPGTLNVGSVVPSFLGSLLFFGAVAVEPVLLASMVISSGIGAWIGAGLVSRMPRRRIQVFMGVALLIAAFFFAMTALDVLPPSGAAMGLSGWRFAVAVVINGVFGALMCIGIGNYAPSMVLLGLARHASDRRVPDHDRSDGVLIPVASSWVSSFEALLARLRGGPRCSAVCSASSAHSRLVQSDLRAPDADALAGHRRHHLRGRLDAALRSRARPGVAGRRDRASSLTKFPPLTLGGVRSSEAQGRRAGRCRAHAACRCAHGNPIASRDLTPTNPRSKVCLISRGIRSSRKRT